MKVVIIEPGVNTAGDVIYRWRCEKCRPERVGDWTKDLADADRGAAIHERAEHAERATA